MNKCLKISFAGEFSSDFFHDFIQKHAKKLGLEGTVQVVHKDMVRIVVCGKKEAIDAFLDLLHKGTAQIQLADIEIEPFLKDKDYRGVFRVIE